MIRVIRVELLKLRTTRLSYGLLATAAGLTALFSILEANSAGGSGGYSPPPLDTLSGFSDVISGGIWSLLLAAVLGVTVSTGEFRHHTATLTYLAVPGRARVLAAIGVAVGSLVRSQLAGVIGVFAEAIIIESLIGGLFTSVRPFLPYTAATTMAGSALGGAAFGPAHGISGGTPLPFLAAAALLAGILAALAAIAAGTTIRHDIT